MRASAAMETRPIVRSLLIFLALTGIIIALPLLGAMLWRDEPLACYLAFPPRLGGVEHAPFSWGVFIGLAVLILACLLPFIGQAVRMAGTGVEREKKDEQRFPSWGYAGVALCAVAWILAWNRFTWFAAYQPYTFPFLWIGYVIIVNALTYKRTGNCLLRERPVYFLALFPASALFWWFFEYLNRFVLNWYYVGIDAFGPWQYVFYATTCFSTVLPAVLSTADLVGSVSFMEKVYRDFVPIRPAHPKASAGAVLIIVAFTLFALALFPDILFPFLWISPLLCLVSLQTLAGREQIFSPLSRGDWTRAVSLAAAALVCGFFWEMWNFFSMPRWEYSIPYVHRCLMFEMPILGYAGYLPFGLECGAVGEFLDNMIPPRNGT